MIVTAVAEPEQKSAFCALQSKQLTVAFTALFTPPDKYFEYSLG